MNEILFQYERVNPTSWAYLSSLLAIALFFKFNRLFCMRNLDLLLIILLSPGLLCIEYTLRGQAGAGMAQLGFIWLFAANGLLLIRMIVDSSMVRKAFIGTESFYWWFSISDGLFVGLLDCKRTER